MREPTKTPEIPEPTTIPTRWMKADGIPQQLASEMLFSYVGDLVYITFGQTQIPQPGPDGMIPGLVEIQPVAKIVLSESAFHKILAVMNSVGLRIPNRASDAGED